MHVFIKDYQILKNIELDFKPGLNVITGPSNNGKSSIIKAIKAAIYTETGSTPIRFGCDFYLVQIKNNNHSVLFQKKQTTATYVVDKETYSKFGTNTPIEVTNAINLKETDLNGNKVQLNFWNQMDKPFLLDKTAGDMFKFIADSGESDNLSNVLKKMVSDRQVLNRDATTLQGSIISIEDTINNLKQKIDILNPQVEKANTLLAQKENYDKLQQLITLSQKLQANINNILSNKSQHNILSNKLSSIDNIDYQKLPKLIDLSTRYKIISSKLESVSKVNLIIPKALKLHNCFDQNKNTYTIYMKKFNSIVELKNKSNKIKLEIDTLKAKINKLLEISNLYDFCPLCGQKLKKGENNKCTSKN